MDDNTKLTVQEAIKEIANQLTMIGLAGENVLDLITILRKRVDRLEERFNALLSTLNG